MPHDWVVFGDSCGPGNKDWKTCRLCGLRCVERKAWRHYPAQRYYIAHETNETTIDEPKGREQCQS